MYEHRGCGGTSNRGTGTLHTVGGVPVLEHMGEQFRIVCHDI